jgi:acyl-coenzyme A synthetase/AMP-(fatty) acid ligase
MPKTPSGKLQRYRVRRLAASRAPSVLHHVIFRET